MLIRPLRLGHENGQRSFKVWTERKQSLLWVVPKVAVGRSVFHGGCFILMAMRKHAASGTPIPPVWRARQAHIPLARFPETRCGSHMHSMTSCVFRPIIDICFAPPTKPIENETEMRLFSPIYYGNRVVIKSIPTRGVVKDSVRFVCIVSTETPGVPPCADPNTPKYDRRLSRSCDGSHVIFPPAVFFFSTSIFR